MAKHSVDTLLGIAKECHDLLEAAGVPHLIIGGLAVCLHGYERNSRDVDLLVRREDWNRIQQSLESAKYVWNSFRNAYYSPSKVRVDFRWGGERPGKSQLALPDPAENHARHVIDGLPVLALVDLLDAKLACALSLQDAEQIKKHLSDVLGLIRSNGKLLRQVTSQIQSHARQS